MNFIDPRILLEQYRPLLDGCWYGVDYKSHACRTRGRMDIRCSWGPLRPGLSITVRRDPMGTVLARAATKSSSVVCVPWPARHYRLQAG
jgi:hypothetical protein